MKPTYYITTPIYYPSSKLHIGNAYTTVIADTVARYKKLRGFDVKFLTGTDEHGLKIQQTAQKLGQEPKQYLDGMIEWIKDLWRTLNIDYDIFIRTTDDYHKTAVQKIFKKLYEQGDIYKGEYEGLYCVPCETFFTENQAPDGKCPDCGRPVQSAKEESYFLRLSKYQDRLLQYIEDHPDFIQPVSRKNEMVNNFLKPGLDDLAVSRTSFKWGIPVDFDEGHVVYVWIDALSNYITALGFLSEDNSDYQKYWPADLHLVGKEIVRFHTIIWPIILMALDQPLPKKVFGHGWLVFDGVKMSKSLGNSIDPIFLSEKFGVDAVRYFLLREIIFGQDGNFSVEALMQRINSDLANDLGNLLSRTVGMIDKYFGGQLPAEQTETAYDADVRNTAKRVVEKYSENMDALRFNDALSEVWNLIRRSNKYIDETAPWVLAKDESKKTELAGIMYTLCEVLRTVAVMIAPAMPNTPAEIYRQLSITDDSFKTWESIQSFGILPKEVQIDKGEAVFPRIDIKKEMAETFGGNSAPAVEETKPKAKTQDKSKEAAPKIEGQQEITIEDFAKIQLKVGEVLACEKVEDSDKLLKSQIRIGTETRQIVSGIAIHYTPEQMVGKKVIVVCNLKPVKLRGVLSQGMILAASDENGKLNAVTVDGDIADGASVS